MKDTDLPKLIVLSMTLFCPAMIHYLFYSSSLVTV